MSFIETTEDINFKTHVFSKKKESFISRNGMMTEKKSPKKQLKERIQS